MPIFKIAVKQGENAGGCPPCCWHYNGNPRPMSLILRGPFGYKAGSLDFVDSYGECGGSNAYFTLEEEGIMSFNIWKARRAGVWHSSIAIDIYTAGTSGQYVSRLLRVDRGLYVTTGLCASQSSYLSGTLGGTPLCSGNYFKIKTMTFNDDGTFSIA